MQFFYKTCLVFSIIGAINWGLIGLLDFNLVTTLFGIDTILTKIVYILVGLSGLISIAILFQPFEETEHRA
jgi:uncharacterized membrane protein YuzA (DUF378 family)